MGHRKRSLSAVAFGFADAEGASNQAAVPYFDSEFLEAVPLQHALTFEVFLAQILPRYEKHLQRAFEVGSAVFVAKTNAGGHTGELQQVSHVVPYIVLEIGRILQLAKDSPRPHVILMDGFRVEGKRYAWTMPVARRRHPSADIDIDPEDTRVADRIRTIITFFAACNLGTLPSKTGFRTWYLPVPFQTADRGCVLHGITNANIAVACLRQLRDLLDRTEIELRVHNSCSGGARSPLDDLNDTHIPALWSRYMYSQNTNLVDTGLFGSNLLHQEQGAILGRKSSNSVPSFHDLMVYEVMVMSLYVAIAGDVRQLEAKQKDFSQKLFYLHGITKKLSMDGGYARRLVTQVPGTFYSPTLVSTQAIGATGTQHAPIEIDEDDEDENAQEQQLPSAR
ncbi:hypothetical protein QFC22_005173 [Naganishia vaughanmartiniae]|uniref:Uncharacterized protein n=1 Tax=Naganishia vaughanmartiniae TaxID=1424756 RepID=A0ACC2WVH5_9TREE|nr:hypothetical protein QFC22_005173 [Naganishia vaughanmartiniae]